MDPIDSKPLDTTHSSSPTPGVRRSWARWNWARWIGVVIVVALVWIVVQSGGALRTDPIPGRSQDDSTTLREAVAALRDVPKTQATAKTATAVFAGGCFWCTEAAFKQVKGVLAVTSGFAGGSKATAYYQRVCEGDTGHAEAIRVTYDPQKITYDQLLDVFFDAHDATQLNRQDNDIGTQYRSAIFYADESQRRTAQAKIDQLTKAKAYSDPIVTTLEPLKGFFPAEDYHQDYVVNHLNEPYIRFHAIPKVCKMRLKHPELMRHSEAKDEGLRRAHSKVDDPPRRDESASK